MASIGQFQLSKDRLRFWASGVSCMKQLGVRGRQLGIRFCGTDTGWTWLGFQDGDNLRWVISRLPRLLGVPGKAKAETGAKDRRKAACL